MNKYNNCMFTGFWCPHLLTPRFQSGFTGKDGIETWWYCEKKAEAIRNINKCEVGKAYNAIYEAKND